jgi:hypothetical protein
METKRNGSSKTASWWTAKPLSVSSSDRSIARD